MGAVRGVPATRRTRQGQLGGGGTAEWHAGTPASARSGGEFHSVRRQQTGRNPQDCGAQSSGARRQQRGTVGVAPGGTEARVPTGKAAGMAGGRSGEDTSEIQSTQKPRCRPLLDK